MNDLNLLENAISNNQVIDYFKGINGFRVQGMNGDENNVFVQDHSRVVSSFQLLYRKNMDLSIPQIFYDNIDKLLDSNDLFDIYTVVKILDSQIFVESSRFCYFKLEELDKLLLKLKNKLLENKDELDKIVFQGEKSSVWKLVNDYNDFNVSRNRRSFL